MKSIFFIIAVFTSITLQAQYYYNDIIGTQETNRQMKIYLTNKVQTVSASGVDAQGRRTSDFSELQEVKENGAALKITTHNNSNNTIYYNRFNKKTWMGFGIKSFTKDHQTIS